SRAQSLAGNRPGAEHVPGEGLNLAAAGFFRLPIWSSTGVTKELCFPRRLRMKCPRCQHENPPQAKFCLECGARVALTCTKCRSELPAGAKFCLECGEPVAAQAAAEPRFTSPESYTPKHLAEKILTSKAALEGERKHVTVLFADLKGSMEL